MGEHRIQQIDRHVELRVETNQRDRVVEAGLVELEVRPEPLQGSFSLRSPRVGRSPGGVDVEVLHPAFQLVQVPKPLHGVLDLPSCPKHDQGTDRVGRELLGSPVLHARQGRGIERQLAFVDWRRLEQPLPGRFVDLGTHAAHHPARVTEEDVG